MIRGTDGRFIACPGGTAATIVAMLRKTLPVLALATLCFVGVGCQKSLFDETQARSPYERYLALRGLDRPQEEMNAYGRAQPALRQRMRPLEQP